MSDDTADTDTLTTALATIASRIKKAERKYGPVANVYETLGAIQQEIMEVQAEVQNRRRARQADELLDVAVVAIRGSVALRRPPIVRLPFTAPHKRSTINT